VNNEWESMWKEAVMAQLEIFQNFPGRRMENNEKP
jgi:hypothetical protein